MPHRYTLATLALTLGCATALPAQRTLLRTGRIVDPASGRVTTGHTIVVENGRITAVGPAPAARPGDSVVDLTAYTVLPGLIDAHVHLVIGGTMRANALADLHAGFTTVVDLGARTTRVLPFRDSVHAGQIPGPRILAAGIWVGKAGGICEFNGIGLAGGADAFRARVRENVAAGADMIKVCVSGWPADAHQNPDSYELPDSLLAAVVDEAGKAGRRVIAHDISAGGVRAVLGAGVQGLAHAAYLDSATTQLLRRRGMFVIPTLASLTAGDTSAVSRDLMAATALAHRAGVTLVFGTDGGVLPHGQNAAEFAALAQAGIPLLDALRSATSGAARALGLADSLGTIAPGMLADVIAVEGDPLTSAAALGQVRFVMSRGTVVRRP